ncbi:MAG: FAD-linked oxidase C-terminal domain-containing protein, partial [Candidatus Acidiferrales bacterium]
RVHAFTHLSHLYPSGSSVYTTFLFRLGPSPEESDHRWRRLKRAVSDAIVRHGGTISHQHGVGTDHKNHLVVEKGVLGIAAIQQIAQTFDPAGMMNPGKLVAHPSES